MKFDEFEKIIARLQSRFSGGFPATPENLRAWFEDTADLDAEGVARAATEYGRTAENIRQGANLGAVLRNRVVPVVTVSTVEQHLHHAVYLAHTPSGDPYGYLSRISPILLEMAERIDLFARDLTTEAQGFRVRDLARQYQERKENEKRGFRPPPPLPPSRQIEAQRPITEMTDEIRARGLANIAAIRQQFGKMPGAVRGVGGQDLPETALPGTEMPPDEERG